MIEARASESSRLRQESFPSGKASGRQAEGIHRAGRCLDCVVDGDCSRLGTKTDLEEPLAESGALRAPGAGIWGKMLETIAEVCAQRQIRSRRDECLYLAGE